MSISIYSAILWKEARKKIKYSQEMGLVGELHTECIRECSGTASALGNHACAGSLRTQRGLRLPRRAPRPRVCYGHVALAFAKY